jgi:2-oxoglutarate dehydrogenase E2 component (dihydrolipoamide succinyltransferase)
MSTVEVRAPAEQTEGTRSQVLRWLKAVGDAVAENEPLIELETDKVTVEVAAPASGVLREIVKHEGDEIEPGGMLGRIEPAGAARTATAATKAPAGGARSATAATSAPAGAATAATPTASSTSPVPPVPAAPAAPAARTSSSAASAGTRGAAHLLSPAVKRLLAERNLEASAVQGTGADGRITVSDVLGHAPAKPKSAPAGLPPSHAVPHSPMRRRIAEHMVESLLHTAPHVTTVFEADMSAVLAHRKRHQEDFEQIGAPLTITAYLVAASVAAIRAVPESNSRWTDEALEVFDKIDIGIATALDSGGLIVPVLRNADSLDLFGIAQSLSALVALARDSKLQPTDVRGGTFTISNHGVSGSLLAAPIVINQPQSAILGVGKLQKRPVVIEEQGEERIVVKPMCYVTLTIDHRVMDGQQANRFLQVFTSTLQHWPVD